MRKNDTSQNDLRKSTLSSQKSTKHKLQDALAACFQILSFATFGALSNRVSERLFMHLGGSEIQICDRVLTNDVVVGLAQQMANLPELQSLTFENN